MKSFDVHVKPWHKGEADCPVCAEPLAADDICATDIELGICHAACLEGSPVVDLDTGEPSDGPVATYRYGDLADPINLQGSGPAPIEPRES